MNISKHIAYIAVFAAIMATSQLGAAVVNITSGSTSGYTMTDGNTYVVQNSVSFINSTAGGSGMTVADNATVVLYVPQSVTLTAKGGNGSGQTGGGAGIRVPTTATLIITGEGTVNATGGKAGNGANGANGGSGNNGAVGKGGNGGSGGGSAGAAIGGNGGNGGAVNGQNGDNSESMGSLYLLGTISSVNASGANGVRGSAGNGGGTTRRSITAADGTITYSYAGGGGGGGGGGAGSAPTCAIGGGGFAGGGGGKGGNGYFSLETSSGLTGRGGKGGNSKTANGADGTMSSYGNAGGAYGAEGGTGSLYVSSTATVDVNRTKLSAETHSAAQYTITFDANGGTFSSSDNTATATLGCALPDCIPKPTNGGVSFAGWATDQSATTMWYGPDGSKIQTSYATPTDTTLYAIWLPPATPVISPANGVVSWPLAVTISCATEGAIIHYTTDGSEPTDNSPVYRRFRISERTTVKAIAFCGGLCSDIAVAEYATGQCADPVITPANGTTFNWSGQPVSIAWEADEADNGVLRYTTDGSDPTADSPIYGGPFTIDDSTVVKAKAFGDQFFDSAVVTANLTRVWANVATPAIAAASSFTGSETKVELSCATPGATIRYTLNGNDPNSHATRYTGPFYVADSCTVKAYATCADYLDSAVATQSIEKVWGIGDTIGAPDHAFATGGDLPFVRVADATAPLGESMKSGAITHSQTSTLSTTVMGPGTISFQWKTSCEDSGGQYDWDHAEFSLDGTVVARLDGESGWQTVSQAIAGDGSHALLWKYVKDDVESEGEDCCWVADYRWGSAYTATQTTPAPVPYAWLRGFFPHTPDEYDAYEAAAKEVAANGQNTVWECYVAGLNPTNETDVFRTVISIGADGEPVIGWEPKLSAAEEAKRTYTIYGRECLTDGDWGPTNAASRFFRVKVSMP